MQWVRVVVREGERAPMLYHERLCPPLQGGVGVGHDFVARQSREVREEGRVDQRGIREALKERNGKMRECIHWEMGTYLGGAERGLPVKWHDIRVQACAQGPMRVRRPSFDQSGKGPAEAGRGGVDRRRGGNESKSGHSSFVRDKDYEWWKAGFRSENRHGSGRKTVGDPSLHLPPRDLHFVKEPFGRREHVSTV